MVRRKPQRTVSGADQVGGVVAPAVVWNSRSLSIHSGSREETKEKLARALRAAELEGKESVYALQRELCVTDLWYLLTYVLSHPPTADGDWCWARCREFQENPDGYLDLWAREHLKSTIITFAGTIQEILRNPNVTVGIFSFSRPIAKGFLAQIKREFEENQMLRALFPDILWEKPWADAPKWSEDSGIIVRRDGNPKEATVEAWGLVDGQPTSKHYQLMVYDDVITKSSTSTTEMIRKVTEMWELSLALGTMDGRRRYIGTRYDYADTYRVIMDRQAAIPRLHPAEDEAGVPVYMTRALLDEKRRSMGPFTYSAQMLLNPVAGSSQSFKEEWLRYWGADNLRNLNLYIVVDPATSKKKNSDYTSMYVLGAGADGNVYVVDMVMDRMNLSERTQKLFSLVRQYRPLDVGYERFGMQADVEYIREMQGRENFRFPITELTGIVKKEDRIAQLVPWFEQGRVYLPYECVRATCDGEKDLVEVFREQYLTFPYCRGHDDMLDNLANITRMNLRPPSSSFAYQRTAIDDGDIYGLAPASPLGGQAIGVRSAQAVAQVAINE